MVSSQKQAAAFVEEIVSRVEDVVGPARPVSLHEPRFTSLERSMVIDCIDTNWVSSVGAYVDRFESELGTLVDGHAVVTSSGTTALHAALVLLGIGPGDEVAIPSLTFVATANAVVHSGARPRLIDCEDETLGLNPAALARHLETECRIVDGRCVSKVTGAHVKAVVPMHAFGHPVDMAGLADVADAWNLAIVEDAAEALGSSYRERPCGTLGRLGVLSFNGNKIVTTGGGGAIVTKDADLAARAKHITSTARVTDRWNFVHDEVAFNYRMPNLNAALGCGQLERLPRMLAAKRRLAERYERAFADCNGASIVMEPAGCSSNYWLVTLKLDEPSLGMRDMILDRMNGRGIFARPVWQPMHELPMFSDCPLGDMTVTERLQASLINLPSSPFLDVA